MKKEILTSSFGEKCTVAELDNGLKIYVVEKSDFSSAYAVYGTRYGSVDNGFSFEGEEPVSVPEGIAHFLEHKLFESEDGDAFSRFAETGAYSNAYTSFDRTCYLFSCSSRFYDNLEILLDFVQHPYFTAKTVKKEQGIIGQEIRMYDDSPDWCVFFNALKSLYSEHPVRIDIAGTVESIAEIDDKLLYKCYETFYRPSNMFVCIAGNVDTDKTLEFIENRIKPTDGRTVIRGVVNEPETVNGPYYEQKLECAIPLFCLGFKLDGLTTLYDRVCMGAALEMLSGDCSPLYEKLTEAGLINDAFDSEYFSGRDFAAVLFQGESAEPEKVKKIIFEEIERIKKEGFSEELFNIVKRALYGDTVKRYNNIKSIVSVLTESAASDCGPFEDTEIIRNMTAEDLRRYICSLDTEKSVLSVVRSNGGKN